MNEEFSISLHKAILWEEAKGKLRALSNVEGHRRTASDYHKNSDKWLSLNKEIENFIKNIENEGLHE